MIVPLATVTSRDARVHNLRAAFVAGLSHGMGKVALVLQNGDDPVPLDYRDLVQSYRHPDQISEFVSNFALEVTEALQASDPIEAPKGGFLANLDMGSSTAENEFTSLGQYYLQTDEFRRTLAGDVRIVVGRKGSGKTAVFAQVRDRIRADKSRIVLDLKPEGYQLKKFKEQVLDCLEEGTREHTITAFWEYLLLLEVCYKILEKDKKLHLNDHRLTDPYQQLADSYTEDKYVREGDFSERMLRLIENISDRFEKRLGDKRSVRLNTKEITELLYVHDIHALMSNVQVYLRFKDELWILLDNLDKGWATHGVSPEDLLIIRCLLDASRKVQQSFGQKGIACNTVIFIRNDVYSLLIDATPDRGKEPRVSMDWSDPDLLGELVRKRLVYNDLPKAGSFDQLWRTICVSHIDGEDSFQYLVERCLMRPRFLLNLISLCRGFAVNFEHERIEEMDIRKGISTFSTDVIYDIDLEIRDILPAASDVLYVFIGQPVSLLVSDVKRLLGEHGFAVDDVERILDILLWYGVLGIIRRDGEISFIYDVNYDLKRLKAILEGAPKDEQRCYANPALWPGLEMATQ